MDHMCQPLHLWEFFLLQTEMAWTLFDNGRRIVASDGHVLHFYTLVHDLVFCIDQGPLT